MDILPYNREWAARRKLVFERIVDEKGPKSMFTPPLIKTLFSQNNAKGQWKENKHKLTSTLD